MATSTGIPSARTPSTGSFVRWQSNTLKQLGDAINLILGFATASLGFCITLIKDKDFSPGPLTKHLVLFSLVTLLISVVVAVWCVLNRLTDFRLTTKIAREREALTASGMSKVDVDRTLQPLRERSKKLGKRTWALFAAQIITFGLGVLGVTACICTVYRSKLL